MSSSKQQKTRVPSDILDEHIRLVSELLQDHPVPDLSVGEVIAHNGALASNFDSNKFLLKRLRSGFCEQDGPIVCATCSEERDMCGRNLNGMRSKMPWVVRMFPDGDYRPPFVDLAPDVSLEDVLRLDPSVVLFSSDYDLPHSIPGYIKVRLRKSNIQLILKLLREDR